jgi:hypothetical protein
MQQYYTSTQLSATRVTMGAGFIIQLGVSLLEEIILEVILTLFMCHYSCEQKNALGTLPARKYISSSTLN